MEDLVDGAKEVGTSLRALERCWVDLLVLFF